MRDLEARRAEALRKEERFGVRHSFDGRPHDPPNFCKTIEQAKAVAEELFARLNSNVGADFHARSEDMQTVEVWIESYLNGEWTRADVRRGIRDTRR